MNRMHVTAIAIVAGAAVAFAFTAWPAAAQKATKAQVSVPDSFSWRFENGRRVPKGQRTDNPDGSWREELRDGNCVTVKEKSARGEYRESRSCGGG